MLTWATGRVPGRAHSAERCGPGGRLLPSQDMDSAVVVGTGTPVTRVPESGGKRWEAGEPLSMVKNQPTCDLKRKTTERGHGFMGEMGVGRHRNTSDLMAAICL